LLPDVRDTLVPQLESNLLNWKALEPDEAAAAAAAAAAGADADDDDNTDGAGKSIPTADEADAAATHARRTEISAASEPLPAAAK
jgi:hypothetical protein